MKLSKKIIFIIVVSIFVLGNIESGTAQNLGKKETIEVLKNSINIEIDGEDIVKENTFYQKNDGNKIPFSIIYKGTTYIPIRPISELLNIDIEWDNNSNKLIISQKNNTLGYQDFEGESSILVKRHVMDIINSYRENIEIIVIGSSDCGACKSYIPKLNNLVKEYGFPQIIYVDTKELSEEEKILFKEEFDIKYIPTTIYVKNGEVARKTIGDISAEDIEIILKDILQ